MPIAVVINGQIYAVHSDHLNTPRRLTDSQGHVVWQWPYSAFGDDEPTTATKRFANLDINPNPGTTGISEIAYNVRWPGQYYDKESGLHYNYFRTLDPRTGRYTQPDPTGLGGGWNKFAYVGGNPLNWVDPLGLAVKCKTIARVPLIADLQQCTEDGTTPTEQEARDAKRMSGRELDRACQANGYEDAHALKRDLGLDSKSDIFADRNGNMYSGPRKGSGLPQYLHMNTRGILPK
jgi:RHS repeat-associated protein